MVLSCTQMNSSKRNVGKNIEVPVSKPVYRSHSTNQSCVQRSQNPRNLEKVYYFVFKFLHSGLFNDSTNKTKAFNLKMNCEQLRLVFVQHVNTECT